MSIRKKSYRLLIPVILIVAGIFYFFADPERSVVMPKCVMKSLTGFQCPSCGGQRALHALLHGHPLQALSYNYFFILSVPLLLVAVYVFWKIKAPGPPSKLTLALYRFVTSRYTLTAYVVLFFLWWVVRNILGI